MKKYRRYILMALAAVLLAAAVWLATVESRSNPGMGSEYKPRVTATR